MDRTDRPKMSRERILEAAIELVERDGVASLSMRKLGAALGLEAMTLYHYVPNKEALLDALVEKIVASALENMTAIIGKPDEWPIWLRAFAVSFRSEMLKYPKLVSLLATRPVMTPDMLRTVERIGSALCEAGYTAQRAFHVINTVTTFVTGHTLAEAGSTPGHEEADPDTSGLIEQLDPAEFPCIREAISCGLGQPEDHQARFDFALDALFAGMLMLDEADFSQGMKK